MHTCHVLSKTETGRYRFGSGPRYSICSYSAEAGVVFRKMMREQMALSNSVEDLPLVTVSDWKAAVEKAGMANESYRKLWLTRATLIGARMARGIADKPLRHDKKLSLSAFAAIFPDQKNYITRIGKHLRCSSAEQLMKKLQYRGAPEYFSMFLCLFLDSRVRQFKAADLKKHATSIRRARKVHKNRAGHEGHPAAVVKAALDNLPWRSLL